METPLEEVKDEIEEQISKPDEADKPDEPDEAENFEIKKSKIEKHGFPFKTCRVVGCRNDTELCCNKCGVAFYCCGDHQKFDWKYHRPMCPVIRFVQGLKCPLTKTFFVHPVKSGRCHHVFEKESILYLVNNNGGVVVCPHDKCTETVTSDDLRDDFSSEKLVVDFMALVELKKKPIHYDDLVKKFSIIDRRTPFGDFWETRETLFMARLLYIGKKKLKKHELFFRFDDKLKVKQLIKNFCKRNDLKWTLSDVELTYKGKSLHPEQRTGDLGLREGCTIFIHSKKDEEMENQERRLSQFEIRMKGQQNVIDDLTRENINLRKEITKLKKKNRLHKQMVCEKTTKSLVEQMEQMEQKIRFLIYKQIKTDSGRERV
jgi:hypothetical protein